MKIQLVIGGVEKSGGAERVMCVLANTFVEMGHDVILSALSTNSKHYFYLNDKVRYIQTGKVVKTPVVRYIHKLIKIRRLMQKERPDAVVSFITPMNCAVIAISRGLGLKLFVSERITPTHYDNTFIGFIRSILYPMATAIVCQTNEAKEYFKHSKAYGKCYVIKNPLTTRIESKKDYSETKRICAVGRLTEQKNYPLMINAFGQFHDKYTEYKLDIFGNGEMKQTLQQIINQMGLEESVSLCGSVDDIGSRLKNYDFFLMTSNYEGMSNALAEAMAAGLPCICTDCDGGGASDLIQSGQNGLLVHKNNIEELLKSMELLAENQCVRERIGKQAITICDTLSRKMIAERWVQLFRANS
jgi:glycosyltransferase involved in cell wall biosynthesis